MHQPHIDVEVAVDLTPVVNRDDMRLLQHRGGTGLPLKPRAVPVIAGKLPGQNLQRGRRPARVHHSTVIVLVVDQRRAD